MSNNNTEYLHKIDILNSKLKDLRLNPGYENAQDLIIKIIDILGIKPLNSKNVYSFIVDQKFKKNENWFQWHPVVTDKRAAELLKHENNLPIELKIYWLNKPSIERIKGIVHFTPNYEDNLFTRNDENSLVGIDFIISKDADSILITLSNSGVIRTLELRDSLNNTQKTIFKKWYELSRSIDINLTKESIHTLLWDSFELKQVNQEFYNMISGTFLELKQHLIEKCKVNDEAAKSFTNRLIGRILFVWFLRKKGLIFEESMSYFDTSNQEDTDYYQSKLEVLFFETLNKPINNPERNPHDHKTPYLNGGLFKKNNGDIIKKEFFPNFFFHRFYLKLEEYNFTTYESTPDFEQVAIDPEMLGRVFENLLASMKTETGEQARKAKGAFYTRRDIVSYMCRETLRNYLYSKKDLDSYKLEIDRIIDTADFEWVTNESNKTRDISKKDNFFERAIYYLDNLKCLDPACGSGAYPIGMLQEILRIYTRLDRGLNEYETKLKILENNIYGVDIDPIAIEISRLRAFLALIVDQEYSEKNSNGGIDTLPNLEFKFACANTLLKLKDQEIGLYDGLTVKGKKIDIEKEILRIKKAYFKVDYKEKEKLEKELEGFLNQGGLYESIKYEQLRTYNPIKQIGPASFYEPKLMHDAEDNFDIVIGNPPYVSTKGTSEKDKKLLEINYGFADDLYSHFYFRGLELCKDLGILSYITSKTFWTIQTKKNLRDLLLENNVITIYDTANPFDSAMVDTCIVTIQKSNEQIHPIQFLKIDEKSQKNEEFTVDKNIYVSAVNKVIFIPNEFNLKIYEKYNNQVKELMEKWWNKIKTSKDIEKNKIELERYRDGLKPGDVTLLGLITEGGQGLATGNNGKYVGVLEGTKEATKVKNERNKKFIDFVLKNKIDIYGKDKLSINSFLNNLSENELRNLFDELKIKYGRDIFGQGFLFIIVLPEEIKDVKEMTEDEKKSGLEGSKTFVPYDKGDKDGNRWYLRTPYYINWSKENVEKLKQDPKARFQGYNFYFRSGFCWSFALLPTQEDSKFIKCRLKDETVNDVMTMALYPFDKGLSKFIVSILNSKFMYIYLKTFINSTAGQQINDFKMLPIIIPSLTELNSFLEIFEESYNIKNLLFDKHTNNELATQNLNTIQNKLDNLVEKIYEL